MLNNTGLTNKEVNISRNKYGSNSEDLIVKVPVGTTVKDADTGVVIADLTRNGEMATIAYGGRGGRGNVSLSSRNNPCPSYAENGEPGEVRNIKVELRMIADVGLVGMPSVGKSTILSMISNANPKIADYHFTTLSPNLGVVTTNSKKSFVIADLPGLIEGASSGSGLGHKFLKHIERTKIIAHIIDISGSEGRDPYEDYLTINRELNEFNPKLLNKQQVIICNKMDLPGALDNYQSLVKKIKDVKIFKVEAINNKGLDEVINYLADLVENTNEEEMLEEEKFETHVLYKFKEEQPFTIVKDGNVWVVKGQGVEKLLKMTNFNSEEAYSRFAKKLRSMGIDEKLEQMGIQEGDIVRILNYEFEYTK